MPFRVLSIDGGGMRGVYSATYLAELEKGFRREDTPQGLDVAKAFQLIVGTSTGAMIGCGLAHGVSPDRIAHLYREHGGAIFPSKLPSGLNFELFRQLRCRSKDLAAGDQALTRALEDVFSNATLGEIWARRKIALAIPAINMATFRSWIFKTPHDPKTNHRDDHYTLVDVCRASSAAPLFRSLAAIRPAGSEAPEDVFCDGGLWANNPVMVALLEALNILERSPQAYPADEEIEIFCLGTCGKPEGEVLSAADQHRGLLGWKFGGEAAKVSIAAQEFAFDFIAQSLCRHLRRRVRIVRFPADKIPAALMSYLDLDETRPDALDALIRHARQDANMTNSKIMSGDAEGRMIESLFLSMPPRAQGASHV